MRGGLRAMLLVSVLSANIAAVAQFKEPTHEELQMTAEPKAPGASAIYLDYEEEHDQWQGMMTRYVRLKILTEKGKEHATVRESYDPEERKTPEVEARTIQPDGSVVPMDVKAVSLVEIDAKGLKRNKLVFELPQVQVGSILEYRIREHWKVLMDVPTLYLQQDEFARHVHLTYKCMGPLRAHVSFVAELPPGLKVQQAKDNWYALDAADVSPVAEEEWMPPLSAVKTRVRFFYTLYPTKQEYWEVEGKEWASLLKDLTKPTLKLKHAAASLVAPGDSETVKARKIYAAVMAMDNTDFTREIGEVERKRRKIGKLELVQDLWTQKMGSGDLLALLFVALCRSAGLDVEAMPVVDRSRAVFDSNVLDIDQFDDLIAAARLDGKEVFLDPGTKLCPFALLHWSHMDTYGLQRKGKGLEIVRTLEPDYRETQVTRIADLTVDESGAVHGTARLIFTGQEALRWRQLAFRSDESELRKSLKEWLQQAVVEGIEMDVDHFLGLDDTRANLIAYLHIGGTLGTATSKRIFLPGDLFAARAKLPFVTSSNRITAVDLHYSYLMSDQITYRLPEGFALQSSITRTDVPWPGYAELKLSSTANAESVGVSRTFAMGRSVLKASEYPALHDYFQKVAAADQQQIVLVRVQ